MGNTTKKKRKKKKRRPSDFEAEFGDGAHKLRTRDWHFLASVTRHKNRSRHWPRVGEPDPADKKGRKGRRRGKGKAAAKAPPPKAKAAATRPRSAYHDVARRHEHANLHPQRAAARSAMRREHRREDRREARERARPKPVERSPNAPGH